MSSREQIKQYLLSRGVPELKAQGILLNIEDESGFSPNPSGSNDSGMSYGLFQHYGPRKDALFQHAGTSSPSWQQQIDYAMTEPDMASYLQGSYGNVGDAAVGFLDRFERPAKKHRDARAAKYRSQYGHWAPAGGAAEAPVPMAAVAAGPAYQGQDIQPVAGSAPVTVQGAEPGGFATMDPRLMQMYEQQIAAQNDPWAMLGRMGAGILNAGGGPGAGNWFGRGAAAAMAPQQGVQQMGPLQMLQAETQMMKLEDARLKRQQESRDRTRSEETMARIRETNPQAADFLTLGGTPTAEMMGLGGEEWQVKTIEEPNGTKRSVLFNGATGDVEPIDSTGLPETAPMPNALPPGIKHTDVIAARKEYNSLPEVKGYNAAATQYDALANTLSELDNPAANVATVFNFMKTLDPTSVVRESEQGMVASASGPMRQFAALFNKALGKGSIGEGERKDLINAARQGLKAKYEAANAAYGRYADISKNQYGFESPDLITGARPEMRGLPDYLGGLPAGIPPGSVPGIAKETGQKVWVDPDGTVWEE